MIPDESNLKWIKNTPNDQSITDQQSFTFNEVRGSGDAELILLTMHFYSVGSNNLFFIYLLVFIKTTSEIK